jgi:hypothetical protein
MRSLAQTSIGKNVKEIIFLRHSEFEKKVNVAVGGG